MQLWRFSPFSFLGGISRLRLSQHTRTPAAIRDVPNHTVRTLVWQREPEYLLQPWLLVLLLDLELSPGLQKVRHRILGDVPGNVFPPAIVPSGMITSCIWKSTAWQAPVLFHKVARVTLRIQLPKGRKTDDLLRYRIQAASWRFLPRSLWRHAFFPCIWRAQFVSILLA